MNKTERNKPKAAEMVFGPRSSRVTDKEGRHPTKERKEPFEKYNSIGMIISNVWI